MKTEGLHAWLLHLKPFKNTTSEVFFLTRERGMVRAYCRGGTVPKKRAILQPFTPLWVGLDERRYGTYVTQLEVMAKTVHLQSQVVLAGLYLNELLYRALKPGVAEPMLFLAYEQVIKRLPAVTSKTALEVALRQFERTLIELLGYQMSYTHEAATHRAIVKTKRYRLVPGEGFILDTQQGFLGAHILAIASDDWQTREVLRAAKQIMRRVIDDVLDGAIIQTRMLYADVVGVEEKL